MLVAYFDASQARGGTFAVAGFALGVVSAKKADRAWRNLWGDTICHMTDLHSRKRGTAFADWTGAKAGAYLKKSVDIINKYASYGVCISCDVNEVNSLAPTIAAPGSEIYLVGFRRAYAVCCHLAMFSLSKMVCQHSPSTTINYFFESGDQYQADSQTFISLIRRAGLGAIYLYGSHTVTEKSKARLLETADILSWEWAKHRERIKSNQPIRPSLTALLDPSLPGQSTPFDYASPSRRAAHITGPALSRYFDKVKDRILS